MPLRCPLPPSGRFSQLQPVFRPNVFVDVSRTLEAKIAGLACYDSETRQFPHPRSPEALRAIAARWGSVAGCQAAEAFELVRSMRPEGHRVVNSHIQIGERRVGPGAPVYVVAELSANHNQDFDQAVRIIQAAKEAGADAVKLQTYTADTITIAM